MTKADRGLAIALGAAVGLACVGVIIDNSLEKKEKEVPGWISPFEARPKLGEIVAALYAVEGEFVLEKVFYQAHELPDGGYIEYWIRYTDGSAEPDLGRPALWKSIPVMPDLYMESMSKKR